MRPVSPAQALALGFYVVIALEGSAFGAADPCARVEGAAEALLSRPLSAEARLELAPLAPARLVPDLVDAAFGAEGAAGRAAYLTLGLSRHAQALKRLRGLPPPSHDERIGRALGLLALGDAAGTATVTAALLTGPVEIRRGTAAALARMHQMRPRRLLYEALVDEDPEVRLIAAEVQVRYRSRRARKVLRAVLASGPEPLRARAARALYDTKLRLPDEDVARMPDHLRGPSRVRNYLNGRRRSPRALRRLLPSRDPVVRAGAFASLAAAGGISPGVLRRWAKVAVVSRGAGADAQLQMALALLGEVAPLAALQAMDEARAKVAADVLWAFSAARAPYHRLEAAHAARLAEPVTAWWRAGLLDPQRAAQTLEALHRADPDLGVDLARRRLAGGPGPAWTVALSILAEHGARRDAAAMLDRLPTLPPEAGVEAVRAAGALCAR